MNRQFPAAQFSRAARSLGIAALCLALSAPLSAQEPRPRAIFEGHVEAVESVSFSPDGKTLASACGRCSIKLWNVASGRNTATLKEEGPGAKKLPFLWATAAFSPEGKKLATGGSFNRVKMWDVATLKGQLFLEEYQQCPETWVVFSPDGKTLASGGVCRGEMKLFDGGQRPGQGHAQNAWNLRGLQSSWRFGGGFYLGRQNPRFGCHSQ